MASCRARTGEEKVGLGVWEPIESSLRRASCVVRRRARVSGTSCEGEKNNRGSKERRKRLQKGRLREEGEGERGGRSRPTHSLTHSPSAKPQSAASRPFPLLSHCGRISIQLYMSSMTMHSCSAQDCEHSTTAVLMTGSCSSHPTQYAHAQNIFGVPRPIPAWSVAMRICSSAIDKEAGRDLNLQSKVPRGHGHVGELRIIPRTTSHAQGSNLLEILIKGTSDTPLVYII